MNCFFPVYLFFLSGPAKAKQKRIRCKSYFLPQILFLFNILFFYCVDQRVN